MKPETKILKKRILDLIGPAHLAVLATITEEGKPWVRYVIPRAGEDLTIRVAVRLSSRKVTQIEKNPEVHLTCGVTDPRNIGTYLQIQGRARVTADSAEREAFWDFHLGNIFQGPDDPDYGVIVIKPYRIELWQEHTSTPEVWED